MPQNIAYLRVSTFDQDLEKKADILHLANEKNLGKVVFVQEKVSGKVSWRKCKIAQLLEELEKGDAILLSEFSWLGRSMLECMEIISIAMEKGIKIYTVKGNWQLDNSIQSKGMVMVFFEASEIERDLISKRTRESLKTQKLAGVKLGRPKGPGESKLDAFRSEIEALLSNGSTQKFIAARYQVTEATLSNWIKKHQIKKSGTKAV